MIWQALNSLAIIGLGIACLLSLRQACVSALSMLKSFLESGARDEIAYLRGEVATLQSQLLAVQHPTVQARMEARKAPVKPYDSNWDVTAQRRRNPMQFVQADPDRLEPPIRANVPHEETA